VNIIESPSVIFGSSEVFAAEIWLINESSKYYINGLSKSINIFAVNLQYLIMTIVSFKFYVRQLKRHRILLIIFIIFIIFWKYTINASINNINAQVYNIDRNWKRDAGELAATPITINTDMPAATSNIIPTFVPIANPLKLNLTFERSLMQWSFPIQVGTPLQTLKIAIDTTYNLLWMVSQLCMTPWGNACGNLTNFFNTSLSNTTKSEIETFTIKYIDSSELLGIWASDTIIINNQTFEQMQIGLPQNITGNANITISNINAGKLGLKAYENNQTMGIALSTKSEDL
ncbi:2481_t:CDS:2, partial [Gigaspora margarita]